MVKLGDDNYKVPSGEWTEYAIVIPEGAKYFAIRCISHGWPLLYVPHFQANFVHFTIIINCHLSIINYIHYLCTRLAKRKLKGCCGRCRG